MSKTEEDAEVAKMIENVEKARAAIVAHVGPYKKRQSPDAHGSIDCPVCGGKDTLRYRRAAYNGHIHAACSTEGCVTWME